MPENNDAVTRQKIIGNRIKYLQEQAKLSQEELANSVKLNRAVVSRIENGTRPIRDAELESFADVFGVTTDYLLGRNVDLGNIPVAAHLRHGISLDDLPENRRKDVEEYIEYQKARYKKELEDGCYKKD